LGKFFSQPEKNLIGAANRKAGHVRRLCGRHVERKTAQQGAKFGLRNLRKSKIPVYSSHCNILALSTIAFSS
jgi:hypothetical protein